mgnify:CR=1 FL=1
MAKKDPADIRARLDSLGPAHIYKSFGFPPLLAYFIASRATVIQCSEAEFIRRLAYNAMLEWIQAGLFKIPEDNLSSGNIPMPKPTRRVTAIHSMYKTQDS